MEALAAVKFSGACKASAAEAGVGEERARDVRCVGGRRDDVVGQDV